jgi:hypothetical protein
VNNSVWINATDEKKEAALYEATRKIELLSFQGTRFDSTQELKFPRYPDLTVPPSIIRACYEIAYSILDGRNIEFEQQSLRVSQQGYASVRTTYDVNIADEAIRHGIPSYEAWSLLKPYLNDPRVIGLVRV